MSQFPPVLANLISKLGQLPTIGNRTAQKLAFYIMSMPEDEALALADAVRKARTEIHLCSVCCNLTDSEVCSICADKTRDNSIICVVESPADVSALEKLHVFHGRYHVLHGAVSPLKNIGPDDIKLKELFSRLAAEPEIKEVFLANSSTPEGEATALYISRLLKPAGIKTTRLAHGLPMGSSLEFADEITLSKAIEGRREI